MHTTAAMVLNENGVKWSMNICCKFKYGFDYSSAIKYIRSDIVVVIPFISFGIAINRHSAA